MVIAVAVGTALTEFVISQGIVAATAKGKESLKAQVQARAASQIAAGTAVPIPPGRLAAFEAASAPFPVTGQARQFVFVGPGSTLTIAQQVALGFLPVAGPDPRFSPSFSLQQGPRSVPLSQFSPAAPSGSSLSERLRLSDGNLRRTLEHGRRNWRELLTG